MAVGVSVAVAVAVGFIGFNATISIYVKIISGLLYEVFSLDRPSGTIQSLACNVRESSVCVCAPSRKILWTGNFWLKSVSLKLEYL